MTAPDREGTFRAIIAEAALGKTKGGDGKTEKPQFVAKFVCTEFYYAPEQKWYPLDTAPEVTGYFILKNNDDSLNEFSLQSLIRGLGWTCQDVADLANKDWAGTRCQVYLKYDTYNGQTTLKVKSMNAFDAVPGGLVKLDEKGVRDTANDLNAKLRAVSGKLGAPKPGVQTPAGGAALPAVGGGSPQVAATGAEDDKKDDIPF